MTEDVMTVQTTQLSANSIRIKTWERMVTWLILVAAVANVGVLVYLFATNWTLAVHGVSTGVIPLVLFAFPLMLIAASLLLVKLNKWCIPLFALHLVGSVGYVVYSYGLSAVPWYYPMGYIVEILVISFTVQLFSRGVLK